MLTRSFAAPATLAVVLLGCGGAAPPPPVVPAPSASSPAAPAAASAFEMTEAPEPADVVLLARWRSPAATFDAVSALAPLPIALKDVVTAALADDKLAKVVLPSASIDVVAALDPHGMDTDVQPLAAVSIGLASWEDARKLAQARGGVESGGRVRFGAPRRGKHRKSGGDPACAVAPATGDAPARLVCGDRDADLDALVPWMTRTLPKARPATSDLHAELRFVPLARRYGAKIRQLSELAAGFAPVRMQIGEPTFDRAVAAGVRAFVGEELALVDDVDTLTLDAALDGSGASLGFALRMRGETSWIASSARERAAGGRAPDAFARLPADAVTASWALASDGKRTAPIRAWLGDLGHGFLAHQGVKAADQRVVDDALAALAQLERGTVSARGPLDPAARGALLAAKGGAHPGKLRESLVAMGWDLTGIDGTPDAAIAVLRDLAVVWSRPSVRASVAKESGIAEKLLPTVRVDAKPAGLPPRSFEADVVLDLEALEAASETVTAAIAEKGGAKAEPAVAGKTAAKPAPKLVAKPAASLPPAHFHVLVVPDGTVTWIATGTDRAALVAHVTAALATAPQSGQLGARASLDPIRGPGIVGGSFVSTAALAEPLQRIAAAGDKKIDADRLRSALPRQGTTPMYVVTRIDASGALTVRADLTVPRAAIDEIVALGIGAVAQVAMP